MEDKYLNSVVLKVLRIKRKLTLEEAAKNIGIGTNTLHKLEKSLSGAKFETIIKVVNYYNLSLSEFFKKIEEDD
jgi:transcriptional regulator with XRE-family HTH domain